MDDVSDCGVGGSSSGSALAALSVSPAALRLMRACGFQSSSAASLVSPVVVARELGMDPAVVSSLLSELAASSFPSSSAPLPSSSVSNPASRVPQNVATTMSLSPSAPTSASAARPGTDSKPRWSSQPPESSSLKRRRGRSALDVLNEERSDGLSGRILTLCKALDDVLGGGVAIGGVTELCGAPGSGKTQIALQLAVDVTIPVAFGGLGGEALFVDTEGGFTASRLAEMAEAVAQQLRRTLRASQSRGDEATHERQRAAFEELGGTEGILAKVHVCRVHSLAEQLAVAHRAKTILRQNSKIKLVIMDSVAFHFRQDSGSHAGQRARILSAHAQMLNALAADFRVAVVVTNQMTIRFPGNGTGPSGSPAAPASATHHGSSDRSRSPSPSHIGGPAHRPDSSSTSYLAPALGESWSHAVTHRLIIERSSESVSVTLPRPTSASSSKSVSIPVENDSASASNLASSSSASPKDISASAARYRDPCSSSVSASGPSATASVSGSGVGDPSASLGSSTSSSTLQSHSHSHSHSRSHTPKEPSSSRSVETANPRAARTKVQLAVRRARLAKSPFLAARTAVFVVRGAGVRDVRGRGGGGDGA